MSKNTTLELALCVDFSADEYYGGTRYMHPETTVRVRTAERPDWKYPNDQFTWDEETAYAQLTLRAQCDDGTAGDPHSPYGTTFGYYRPYEVGANRAELMAKTLRAIERKLKRMDETEGTPQSYGQRVNRLARALGAKTVFVRRSKPSQYHPQDEMQYHYSETSLRDVAGVVDSRIHEWFTAVCAR